MVFYLNRYFRHHHRAINSRRLRIQNFGSRGGPSILPPLQTQAGPKRGDNDTSSSSISVLPQKYNVDNLGKCYILGKILWNEKKLNPRTCLLSLLHQFTTASQFKDCIKSNSLIPEIENSVGMLWTATFTHPITGEFFSSGKMKTARHVRVLDGAVFYNRRAKAELAATARALDCYALRNSWEKCGESIFPDKIFEGYRGFCNEGNSTDDGWVGDMHLLYKKLSGRNPKTVINDRYQKILRVSLPPNSYCFESIEIPSDYGQNEMMEYWTASFQCPITKEIFSSGSLKSEWIRHDETIKVIDGKFYYSHQKDAEAAASGKAFDCLSFREFQDKQKSSNKSKEPPQQYCIEKPYLAPKESIQPFVDVVDGIVKETLVKKGKRSVRTDPHPKEVVNNLYQKILRKKLPSDMYVIHSITINEEDSKCDTERHYFNASFKCPVTGELFPAGTLMKEEWGGDNSMSERKLVDGKVYYTRQREAEQAAAGMASDCLTFRGFWLEKGVELGNVIPRFCIESPNLVQEEETLPIMHAAHGGESVSIIPSSSAEDIVLAQQEIEVEIEEKDEEYIIQHVPGVYSSNTSVHQTAMDRIVEAWVETPSSTNVVPKNLPRPSSCYNIDHISSYFGSTMFNKSELLAKGEESISNALSWCNQMNNGFYATKSSIEIIDSVAKRQPYIDSISPSPISVVSCNAILNALANANKNYLGDRINDKNNLTNTELLSKQMLTQMIESSAYMKPNVYSFNAYIKCLRRKTLIETATVAESILNGMLNEDSYEGYPLPFPNIETYNAVIELWGKVPTNTSQKKVDELLSNLKLMETRSIKPNRNTFLAALASLSNCVVNDSKSRLKAAEVLITQMEEHQRKYNDENLLVDTEVYNAPLPLSGGVVRRGTSFSFSPSFSTQVWDNYASKFEKDLSSIDETDPLVREAMNIEEWVINMERAYREEGKTHLAPNIETYESVIQAWVKTGCYKGIRKAESWALRAIDTASFDPSVTPRLHTFHPIIAAWAHCGTEKGPENVEEWISRLNELSKSMSQVKPDGRVHSALILAYRNYQRNLNNSFSSISSHSADVQTQEAKNEKLVANSKVLKSIAMKCSESLKDILHDLQEQMRKGEVPQIFLNGSSFIFVANAWKDAEQLDRNIGVHNNSNPSQSHQELVRLLTILDNFVDSCRDKTENIEGNENYFTHNSSTNECGFQILNLMHYSHLIYSTIIEQLYQDAVWDHNLCEGQAIVSEIKLGENLILIEKMLRRSNEYMTYHKPIETAQFKKKEIHFFDSSNFDELEYIDMFSYEGKKKKDERESSLGALTLYTTILKFCSTFATQKYVGDVVRLVFLIMNQIKENRQKQNGCHRFSDDEATKVYLEGMNLISSVIPDGNEKTAIIRSLYKSLDSGVKKALIMEEISSGFNFSSKLNAETCALKNNVAQTNGIEVVLAR